MKSFNYEKAYFVQALPAFKRLNDKQKEVHQKLLPLVKNLSQQKVSLNIPVSDEMKVIVNVLTCKEIAELSRASYFIGHWKPSLTPTVFDNASGESWKVSNVLDQVLRERLKTPHNIQIHEGKLRVTFSSKDCWLWDEFGLATERNLEIFKNCKLPFGMDTIEASARGLAVLCGDLWSDVEEMPDNEDYKNFLEIKKVNKLEKLKKRHSDRLIAMERKIQDSKKELQAFQWLIENNISEELIENCIYYNHTDKFCFGWREKLTEQEKEELARGMIGFPFQYEMK